MNHWKSDWRSLSPPLKGGDSRPAVAGSPLR